MTWIITFCPYKLIKFVYTTKLKDKSHLLKTVRIVVRPINLNLLTIRFPVTALVSIGHRLTGIWLFLGIPLLIALFQLSIELPAEDWSWLQPYLTCVWCRLGLWSVATAGSYHILAGLRHLMMDLGYGESFKAAKQSAFVIFGLVIITASFLGYCLW